ncbi:MAG: MOSC domain-containing protein [Acidimicrobiia bacterium]
MAKVAALTYYPVKGLGGISVDHAEVLETGLAHDREFMLVNPEDGRFHSQRTIPRLAAIRVAYDGAALRFTIDGHEELAIEATYDGPRRDVSVHGRWFGSAVEQDARAARWFTDVLGQPATLARVPPDHDRPGWGVHQGKIGFADAHAVLITSQSSLDELNARILETGGEPVPMNRFRPNIVVAGWPEPHTEDNVLEAMIGTVHLGYSARAIRCAVPRVDQATGERTGPEPIKTLSTYRRQPDYDGGVSFGMKAAVLRPGRIAVGDKFCVETWLPEGDDPGAIAHNTRG